MGTSLWAQILVFYGSWTFYINFRDTTLALLSLNDEPGKSRMNLFAYGTLMDPKIMARVSGMRCRAGGAVLSGYVRRAVRGEVYPAIAARPGETVDGVVYFDLTPEAFERLDRFEGPMYRRTGLAVTLQGAGNGKAAAEAYVIAPGHLDRLSDRNWSFEEFLKTGKARFQGSYEGYGELE